MSNVVAFRDRAKPARQAPVVTVGPAASTLTTGNDGVAFAVAASKGWLDANLHRLAHDLETIVQTLDPDLAAAQTGLTAAFIRGFAEECARRTGSDRRVRLTTQLSMTEAGLAEDTFYWRPADEAELR